ncbi:gamma carbonic anhydrase family protein [Pokkaliibacter plantistimulans]|uniref:Gamma carbonic anhydrase family protein n=1 Tax=Proteobacteria bacterium 228 TaxID=2083153 RepID=A0A2S5KIR4_9PROT|nr:gamma carbonic anhydrase family protein [Pokkaliibacter plantistimulans]PPC74711.1 gamma carbonic anhydrase family protein [Pokkaliibacter plantistimulans]
MSLYSLGGISPSFADEQSVWIAPNASVIGAVMLGNNVSIWFGSVVRGDNVAIEIGDGTNIQDNAILHSDQNFPLKIGKNCTIGHGAIVHGCTIGEGSLIGMGAIVLDGATIGKGCIVGAGAVVTEGKAFPEGTLILGAPAKVVRILDEETVTQLTNVALLYQKNATRCKCDLRPVAPHK